MHEDVTCAPNRRLAIHSSYVNPPSSPIRLATPTTCSAICFGNDCDRLSEAISGGHSWTIMNKGPRKWLMKAATYSRRCGSRSIASADRAWRHRRRGCGTRARRTAVAVSRAAMGRSRYTLVVGSGTVSHWTPAATNPPHLSGDNRRCHTASLLRYSPRSSYRVYANHLMLNPSAQSRAPDVLTNLSACNASLADRRRISHILRRLVREGDRSLDTCVEAGRQFAIRW